jgi:hypothetical protein
VEIIFDSLLYLVNVIFQFKIAVSSTFQNTKVSKHLMCLCIYLRRSMYWSWVTSVTIMSDYRLDNRSSIPGRGKRFFSLAAVSKSDLRPTQPPVQWVPGVLSPG